ncbi:MAG: MFS transporter [Pseudomonadota bacterium]
MDDASIKFRTILLFGTVAFPLGMIGLPIAIYLAPLYSGQLGIGLGIIGAALIGTRLLDFVTDPLIGILSDRWRPKMGRRRVWLIIGTLTLGAGIYMLFCPPAGISAVYFVLAVSLAYLGLTTLRLPYTAWAAEISSDYHARTKISSTTQFFAIAGLLASTIIPAVLIARYDANSVEIMRAIGWTIIVLLPITSTTVYFTVPEPEAPTTTAKFDLRKAASTVLTNGPFIRLTLASLVATLGETFRQSTTIFFARDVVGVQNIGQVYLFYFVAALIFIPVWSMLAKRLEKHRALITALLIVALTNGLMVFLSAGDNALFYALFVLKGACYGGVVVLPYAMIADTVDVDTAESLDRQQGLFYSVEAMVQKLGSALGAGIPLILLAFVGYNAAGEKEASPLLALSLIYSLIPSALVLIAAFMVVGYSLTASKQKELRGQIADRKAQLSEP